MEEYKKHNGDCLVPRKYEVLGKWVQDQRKKMIDGKLSEDQFAKLDGIRFVWEVMKKKGVQSEGV